MTLEWLGERHRRLQDELETLGLAWLSSPAIYVAHQDMVSELRRHARGRLLDVGCGRMPYRPYVSDLVETYEGLDIERRSPDTKHIADAQDMREIPDASFDTVIALSCLEHVPRPWRVVAEIARVCKPGAKIVLEVPHLSRLHEEPHDYYRFTAYGLRTMGADARLRVLSTVNVGGLACFLGHQVSAVVLSLAWSVPALRWIAFWLNYWLCVRASVWLDRACGTQRKYPMSVLAVLEAGPEAEER